MPTFAGEPLDQRLKHVENLRTLDGAVTYKGKSNEQWVRMKALDLMKAPGFGRKKPIAAKAILAEHDTIVNKETFKMQNFVLIEGDSSYFSESLKSFLSEFNT